MVFRVKFPYGVERQSHTTIVFFFLASRLFYEIQFLGSHATYFEIRVVHRLHRMSTNLERNLLLLLNPCCSGRNGFVSFQGYLCVSQHQPRLEYELVTDNRRFSANIYYGTCISHYIYK